MKRRLVKAIRYDKRIFYFSINNFVLFFSPSREKADLFNSIYSYEVKLEEEQSKQWMHEDDVLNCSKCNAIFGWTVRKVSNSINLQ
jgi:hypothetical protein